MDYIRARPSHPAYPGGAPGGPSLRRRLLWLAVWLLGIPLLGLAALLLLWLAL